MVQLLRRRKININTEIIIAGGSCSLWWFCLGTHRQPSGHLIHCHHCKAGTFPWQCQAISEILETFCLQGHREETGKCHFSHDNLTYYTNEHTTGKNILLCSLWTKIKKKGLMAGCCGTICFFPIINYCTQHVMFGTNPLYCPVNKYINTQLAQLELVNRGSAILI